MHGRIAGFGVCVFTLAFLFRAASSIAGESDRPAFNAPTLVQVTASGKYRDVAFGDLNHDGLTDLVAGSSADEGLHVFVVDHSRNWIEEVGDLPSTGSYNAVALCDIDHNGMLDLIAANTDGFGVRVYLRTGPGSWTEASAGLPPFGLYPNDLVVRDFDRDGNPDIALTSNGHGVRVFAGDGGIHWTARAAPSSTGNFMGLAAWDWSGNGRLDLIAGGQDDNGLVYWRQTAPFNFISSDFNLPDRGVYNRLALTDANHDGLLDIVATRLEGAQAFSGDDPDFPAISPGLPDGKPFIGVATGFYPPDIYGDAYLGSDIDLGLMGYSGLVSGGWVHRDTYSADGSFWGIAVADSDGDGAEDVAAARSGGGIQIWYNTPLNIAPEWLETPSPTLPAVKGICVAAADTNRDGRTDLVIGSDGFGLAYWTGDGGTSWTDATPAIFPTNDTISEVVLEDFDSDLKPDVVAGSGSGHGIYFFRRATTNTWVELRTGLPTTEVYYCVHLADLDHNGSKEILAGRKDVGFEVYSYDSVGGNWSAVTSPLGAGTVISIASMDFDRNGLMDIVASIDTAGLRAWVQRPLGTWVSIDAGLPNSGRIRDLVVTDLDHDGYGDIACPTIGNGIEMYSFDPFGPSWRAITSPISSGNFRSLDAVDFNLDGLTDLLATGELSGVTLLGATAPAVWTEVTSGALPTAVTLGDAIFAKIDFDPMPDIVSVDEMDYCRVFLSGDATPPGDWENFQPTGWLTTLDPTSCTVEVTEAMSGLNASSALYEFSRDNGSTWEGPFAALCEHSSGVAHTTIIAPAVDFGQESLSHNRIRFYISDLAGNVGQSPNYTVKIDATPPPNPDVADTFAHTISEWSRHRVVTIEWNFYGDAVSGVAGYSWEFSHNPFTVPDAVVDPTTALRRVRSPGLDDADDWYFHVRAVDRAGNAPLGAFHVGPFWIDSTPPPPPTLTPTSHDVGVWSNDNTVDVDVGWATDNLSGTARTRYMFSRYASTVPVLGEEHALMRVTSMPLDNGSSWTCHVQTRDRAGNYSEAVHLGQFWIDRTAPRPEIYVDSISGSTDYTVSWDAEELLSGLSHFDVQRRESGNVWEDWQMGTTATDAVSTGAPGSTFYFRARATDNAGNTSAWTDAVQTRVGREVTVVVINESFEAVSGAQVFHNDRYIGRSNSMGAVTVHDVVQDDRLCARKLLAYWDTDRPNRTWDNGGNPWCARVYITSVEIQDDGDFGGLFLTEDPEDHHYLILRRDNALVGFNVVCSVGFDASDDYLDKLREGFIGASEYLYKATDGQFFLERIDIRDNRSRWKYADYHINNYVHTANAATGWPLWRINQKWSGSQIRLPRTYRGDTYEGDNRFPVMIHEFGHYGLRLKDEYEQHVYNWSRARTETLDRDCTAELPGTDPLFGQNSPLSACVMTTQNWANNFCDDVTSNPHRHDTEQHDDRGKSCWRCIVADWNDDEGADDWILHRPAESGRDFYIEGPDSLPSDAWRSIEVNHRHNDGAVFDITMTVLDPATSAPVVDANVSLAPFWGILSQGQTNSSGEILLVGMRAGMIVFVYNDSFAQSYMIDTSGTPIPFDWDDSPPRYDTMTLETAPVDMPKMEVAFGGAPYQITVTATPGATSSTLEVAVTTSETLIEPPDVSVYENEEDMENPLQPVLTLNAAENRYEGEVQLEPTGGLRGAVLVNAIDLRGRSATGIKWFEFIVPPTTGSLDWESHYGDVQLWAPLSSIKTGALLYVEDAPLPAPLPAGLGNLNGPYRIAGNPPDPIIEPAVLKLAYVPKTGRPYVLDENAMAIYMWDESASNWVPLDSTKLLDGQETAAPIERAGVFVLAAPMTYLTATHKSWTRYQ